MFSLKSVKLGQICFWPGRAKSVIGLGEAKKEEHKSDNLHYNTVGRWVDETIVLLSDGPMFILIDWE